MNRAGFPDGVNQAVHDREMAETDGNERLATMRRDQAVDQYAIAATTHPQSASALMVLVGRTVTADNTMRQQRKTELVEKAFMVE